ncbi:TPA: YhcH/YjgK/YiaL family protein [Streptococcus pneumoniae]
MELVEFKNGHVNTVHEHIAITKVKEFLNNHDISKDKGGIHKISTDFFYNIIDMETTTEENRPWESHKEYYDVHYLLNGEETILYNFLSQMLEPNDAHKTGLLVEEPINIKKVVFKVKI